jgi:hypothetical protein
MLSNMSASDNKVISPLQIEKRILLIRDQKVMIDADLAALYGVTTKRLNEQVKRNIERFPEDFMFRLSAEEKQQVVANCDHLAQLKFSRTLPFAFTEYGAIQAANVLNSSHAVDISVYIVRTFVRLREMIIANKELADKLDSLEQKLASHDQAIVGLINTMRELMAPPPATNKRPIGFVTQQDKNKK